MKELLNKLFEHQKLTRLEAKEILVNITQEKYDFHQVAAFLTVFNMRPVTVEELSGFRDALLELCIQIDLGTNECIDIVGTGGDGKDTFNISTLSAVVIAGAGFKVAKHGNYSVSSVCGSSDVLEHFGYKFTNDEDSLRRQFEENNLCFLHAPKFHPSMKSVAPLRRSLKVKTFFNMLGPLVNPIQPKYSFLGVFNKPLSRLYQSILINANKEFSVVYALDGYDEISLTGDFLLRKKDGENVLSPTDIGKTTYAQSDIHGGDSVREAAEIFEKVLNGTGTKAQNDVVTANAGLAIHTQSKNKSILDCIAMAQESIDSKKALNNFKKLIS